MGSVCSAQLGSRPPVTCCDRILRILNGCSYPPGSESNHGKIAIVPIMSDFERFLGSKHPCQDPRQSVAKKPPGSSASTAIHPLTYHPDHSFPGDGQCNNPNNVAKSLDQGFQGQFLRAQAPGSLEIDERFFSDFSGKSAQCWPKFDPETTRSTVFFHTDW